MALVRVLKKGAADAALSYKQLLVIWVVSLIMILFVSFPLRVMLNAVFGNSMAVMRLTDGFDAGLLGDVGKPFLYLLSAAGTGGLLLLLAGFLLYTFFAGGLFASYATAWGGLKMTAFIKESARNFLPFLKINLLTLLIIAGYTFVVLGIPAAARMALSKGSMPEGGSMAFLYFIWILGLPLWLFVADASRRWIAATGSDRAFRAMGAGFRALKERFWLSYGTVLLILIFNAIFIFLSFWYLTSSVPEKGGMIFLFFILSQIMVFIRLFMKAWRYASVCEAAR
jgi:hypothetical protein